MSNENKPLILPAKYKGATEGPWGYDSNVGVIYGRGERYAKNCPTGFSVNQWNDVAHIENKFNYDTREYKSRSPDALLIADAPLLAADIVRLREKLESIRNHYDMDGNPEDGYGPDAWRRLALEMAEVAREALESTKEYSL